MTLLQWTDSINIFPRASRGGVWCWYTELQDGYGTNYSITSDTRMWCVLSWIGTPAIPTSTTWCGEGHDWTCIARIGTVIRTLHAVCDHHSMAGHHASWQTTRTYLCPSEPILNGIATGSILTCSRCRPEWHLQNARVTRNGMVVVQ